MVANLLRQVFPFLNQAIKDKSNVSHTRLTVALTALAEPLHMAVFGDTELTARNMAAAESRPNRFCVRRTSG